MSSKFGLILSLVFFAMFFTLSVDIMCIQYYYSDLDSKSVVIGYEIARLGVIEDEDIKNIEDKYHVNIMNISNRTPDFGDVISYTISVEYKPIVVSNDVMQIQVERNTVMGYY